MRAKQFMSVKSNITLKKINPVAFRYREHFDTFEKRADPDQGLHCLLMETWLHIILH